MHEIVGRKALAILDALERGPTPASVLSDLLDALNRGACPDCGSSAWYEGPHGGISVNVRCAGCGAEFNICLPRFAERI